jgi:hypothetical protein
MFVIGAGVTSILLLIISNGTYLLNPVSITNFKLLIVIDASAIFVATINTVL